MCSLRSPLQAVLSGNLNGTAFCRAEETDEKCSTLGGSKAPLTVAASGEIVQRVPGVALIFSDTVSEVPPVFTHMLQNLPAMYETVVLITVRWALLTLALLRKVSVRIQQQSACSKAFSSAPFRLVNDLVANTECLIQTCHDSERAKALQ